MPPSKRLPDGRDIAALREDGTSRWIRSGARFECSKCDWSTPLEPEMKRHYKSRCAADSELLPCNLKETCKERYLTLDDVSQHERDARHDVSWFKNWTPLGGNKARCKICEKEYGFNRRKQHEIRHQGQSIVMIEHDASHLIPDETMMCPSTVFLSPSSHRVLFVRSQVLHRL